MSTFASVYGSVGRYIAPPWSNPLRSKPTSYVKLALRPTPIHRWNLPGVPSGYEVWVKRDDMAGSVLGGNKIRKLEFFLADALERGCDSVITSGNLQSNQCRVTALAARQLGLQPHLLLRHKGEMPKTDAVGSAGNLLLDRIAGSKIILTPDMPSVVIPWRPSPTTLSEMVQDYAEQLKATGSNPYIVPLGRSNGIGLWGYIEAFRELMNDGAIEKFDDIVVATGSGETICGLAIANYLTGLKVKLHGISTGYSCRFLYKFIAEELDMHGVKPTRDGDPVSLKDLVSIVDKYKGLGYEKNTEEELVEMVEIMNKTAVPLDPVYTLKGVRGLLGELRDNPSSFAGKRILFIHTGGIFRLYEGKVGPLLQTLPQTNQVSIFSQD